MLAPNPDIQDLLQLDAKPNWWRQHRTLLLIGGAAALLVLAGGTWWWIAQANARAVQYKTAAVAIGDLVVAASTMGTVEPITQVDVGSEISGTVTRVNVTYNDQVEAQQVLAEISTDQLTD
jgi:HlyD family secretion protein